MAKDRVSFWKGNKATMPVGGIPGRLLLAYVPDENGERSEYAECWYDVSATERIKISDPDLRNLGPDSNVVGDLNFNNHNIKNLADPKDPGDAANKKYVDAQDTKVKNDLTTKFNTEIQRVEKEYKAADQELQSSIDDLQDQMVVSAIPFAVCSSVSSETTKVVTIDGYHDEDYIMVEFKNDITTNSITLSVNETRSSVVKNYNTGYSIANAPLTGRPVIIFFWDGSAWNCEAILNYQNFLNLDGGKMNGDIDMGGHSITNVEVDLAEGGLSNVPDPVENSDAVNKKYVDDGLRKKEDFWSTVTYDGSFKLETGSSVTIGMKPMGSDPEKGPEATLGLLYTGSELTYHESKVSVGDDSVDISVRKVDSETEAVSSEDVTTFNADSVDVHNHKIVNVPTPIDGLDAVNKDYVDNAITGVGDITETPLPDDLNAGDHNITDLKDPVQSQDAATKNYVDNLFESINSFEVDAGPDGAGYDSVDALKASVAQGAIGTVYLVKIGAQFEDSENLYAEYFWTGTQYELFDGPPNSKVFLTDGSRPLEGDIDLGEHRITNSGDPAYDNDLVNKKYVDGLLSSGGGSGEGSSGGAGYKLDTNGGDGYDSVDALSTTHPSGELGTIYLVKSAETAAYNQYLEYIWTGSAYEQLGSPEGDITNIPTKDDIKKYDNSVLAFTCDSPSTPREVNDENLKYEANKYFIIKYTYSGDIGETITINGKEVTITDTFDFPLVETSVGSNEPILYQWSSETMIIDCGHLAANYVQVNYPSGVSGNLPIMVGPGVVKGKVTPLITIDNLYFDYDSSTLFCPIISTIIDDGRVVTES